MSMSKRILISIAVGVLATATLIVLSFTAHSFGLTSLGDALFWQNTLLQSLAPLHNIGTSTHPVYEGTPLNLLAFLASIPLGILIYSLVAYAAILEARRRV